MSTSALVIESHSNRGVARLSSGEIAAFHFPRRLGRPLPGDHIELDGNGTLESIGSRVNTFGRGDAHGRFQAVAANLDRALIVIAPEPAPSPDLVHRYLAAALIQGIQPVIVINKCDLTLPDQPPFNELADLAALDVPIVHCRCQPAPELNELTELVGTGTSLLAGQSGVGKTSLLNALVPDLAQQTGALSRVTGKGTHTTTSATLHQLPTGAWLVDTPGVWEYGLWHMPCRELERGFPEFHRLQQSCRFRDCRHSSEPGCAVRAACESGHIPPGRCQAWQRLLAEQQRLQRL
ncbi:MAG: ribosome small subunit-dependent GTPase A [Wenzhouxiangella sp.]|nr:MAG: ribosome small subunit-dependent GTPase A [Wenzhouxiangella sp.]